MHERTESSVVPTRRGKLVAYWATTGLLSLALVGSGIAKLTLMPALVESMEHLGFPTHLLRMLGFWMLPGAAALLVPRMPRLKEWAYAGVVFQMTGAAAAHLLVGDTIGQAFPPIFLTMLAVASYLLRPGDRRGA
ncbi:MAG: DoxX family protein [Nannocystales bacterium]